MYAAAIDVVLDIDQLNMAEVDDPLESWEAELNRTTRQRPDFRRRKIYELCDT